MPRKPKQKRGGDGRFGKVVGKGIAAPKVSSTALLTDLKAAPAKKPRALKPAKAPAEVLRDIGRMENAMKTPSNPVASVRRGMQRASLERQYGGIDWGT